MSWHKNEKRRENTKKYPKKIKTGQYEPKQKPGLIYSKGNYINFYYYKLIQLLL